MQDAEGYEASFSEFVGKDLAGKIDGLLEQIIDDEQEPEEVGLWAFQLGSSACRDASCLHQNGSLAGADVEPAAPAAHDLCSRARSRVLGGAESWVAGYSSLPGHTMLHTNFNA